ncbi:GNAT family N-acetyltransferase [Blastococcus jejuensis]|uniref:GNAT family N-acetyltransferase n=1 Tax=Blastococcus jejuensis TaxID=351224 RepID=A0ABP6NP69_9ACTN
MDPRADQPTLTGPRVRLRPWRDDDVDAVFAACQDAEIQRWTEVPVPYRREHAAGFVGEIAARTWAAGGGQFAVETREGTGPVGAMTLFPPRDGVGAGGYWTGGAHRGRGFTGEALRILAGWAFDELGLRRLELVVDPANAGSRGVAESAGFRAEGVLRQRSLHRGTPVDDVIYGLLAGDPRPDA